MQQGVVAANIELESPLTAYSCNSYKPANFYVTVKHPKTISCPSQQCNYFFF